MDAFVGEIRLMGFGNAPRGWVQCAGQLLAINTNQALFSLLGTMYGGNGTTTFAVPDLRGRVMMGFGQGPGLSNYTQGQAGGSANVTLIQANIPMHNHSATGTLKATAGASGADPNASYPAQGDATQYSTGTANATMGGSVLSGNSDVAGGSQAHENRQPLMALNYCIATTGIYPSRN